MGKACLSAVNAFQGAFCVMDLFTDEATTVKTVLLRSSACATGDRSMTWCDVAGKLNLQLYRCKEKMRIYSVIEG